MTEIPQSTIEAALRAVYDAWPSVNRDTGKPRTYEECYGTTPREHLDDVAEMRVAIQAALDEGGVVLASDVAQMRAGWDADVNWANKLLLERDALREAAQAVLDALGAQNRDPHIDAANQRLRAMIDRKQALKVASKELYDDEGENTR